VLQATRRCGRLLQRLVGQPVTERVSWLSSARSVRLSILEGAVSWSSSGNAARKEAERSVASLKGVIRRPARSGGPASPREAKRLGAPCRKARVLQGSDAAETSGAAEPVVFHHGREERVQQPSARLASTRAGENGAVSLSRPVAEDEAKRTVCKTSNALLVLGQSDRTARQPRPPVNPISNSTDRR
jgi:hypothetical protein